MIIFPWSFSWKTVIKSEHSIFFVNCLVLKWFREVLLGMSEVFLVIRPVVPLFTPSIAFLSCSSDHKTHVLDICNDILNYNHIFSVFQKLPILTLLYMFLVLKRNLVHCNLHENCFQLKLVPACNILSQFLTIIRLMFLLKNFWIIQNNIYHCLIARYDLTIMTV